MHLVHESRPVVPRDRLLPIEEVRKLTGLGTTSIYRLMKLGQFPRNVRLSTKCVRWPESRVLQYVQDRIAEADGKAAGTDEGQAGSFPADAGKGKPA